MISTSVRVWLKLSLVVLRVSGSQAMLDAMNVPSTGIPDANTDPRIAAIYDCNPDGEYVAYNVKLSDTEKQQYL
jgi:hypothetical protein